MPRITINGTMETVGPDTLSGLVDLKKLKPESIVIEKNGSIVKRAQWPEERLSDGDVLEIVTFVSGG